MIVISSDGVIFGMTYFRISDLFMVFAPCYGYNFMRYFKKNECKNKITKDSYSKFPNYKTALNTFKKYNKINNRRPKFIGRF